jgi:hypothetical protein
MPVGLTHLIAGALLLAASAAGARSGDEPIRLAWTEGDVAGMSTIYRSEGAAIGFIQYHQHRRDNVLSAVRVARFADGSSDEDHAEARVGTTLQAIAGRTIIREPDGETVVDLTIDVARGRLTGSYGRGAQRRSIDEAVALPPATYWGPLIFLVLKNFDANAEDGRVRFRTVAPTPKPIVLQMELQEVGDPVMLDRMGARLDTRQFELRPTIHWTIDPLVHLIAPNTRFWVLPGDPPALARYAGPRNYGRQPIRIE